MKKSALELLRDELMGEKPPEGWYTIEQISEKLGARRNLIESLVARKKYAIKKCRALSKDGKLVMINHYHTGKL